MAKEPKTQRQKLLILAKKGDPDSQEQLGWAYETGNCGTQIISIDYIEAIKWYKEAAKNGKTFSLFRLGTIYENHNNLKVAYSYYSQAADQCHEKSIEKVMLFGEKYNIDISSINHNSKQESVNKIVERNDEQNKIILNLEIESLKGDINSQLKLGKIFFKYEDYKQAFKWYSMAANKGDRTAQWMIGTMFETGKGVIENLDESIVWYKKSAEQNDVNS
ncbi:MAG: tetratricopeptide repeat protein, partial [bacterium]